MSWRQATGIVKPSNLRSLPSPVELFLRYGPERRAPNESRCPVFWPLQRMPLSPEAPGRNPSKIRPLARSPMDMLLNRGNRTAASHETGYFERSKFLRMAHKYVSPCPLKCLLRLQGLKGRIGESFLLFKIKKLRPHTICRFSFFRANSSELLLHIWFR